ncbi:hypothetical protein F511_38657 [Dorcoceras hygrometricum]|uniref:Uncharacterized protein n=1 Tax=Dorcoceras hygrometricum TaxID=472368 RepID=A0A2Z7BNL3_9LAMI|nr:hypothetical protein F511_38657 [Dorcoceras hygrometricum]
MEVSYGTRASAIDVLFSSWWENKGPTKSFTIGRVGEDVSISFMFSAFLIWL